MNFQNYYFVSPEKASLAYKVAETEREILKSNTKDMISLYIGIPFAKPDVTIVLSHQTV